MFGIEYDKWVNACPIALMHPTTITWALLPDVEYETFFWPANIQESDGQEA